VTISLIKLEKMGKYISFSGDHFGQQIIQTILFTLYENFKGHDTIFVISPEEYLIASCNRTPDEVKAVLKRVSFKVKSLLLSYRSNQYMVRNINEPLENIWRELKNKG
jgi:hypothetical protein